MKTIETLNPEPFRHFCMTIGELPTSYMESMTYYEMLAWFCDYLQNKVIPAINENAQAVTELQGLYIQLKKYVDDYFNSTDFQELVNNKLDEMVDDGTLSNLLAENLELTRSYDTIDEMTQATNLFAGQIVSCYGEYMKNDGKGGTFKISSTSEEGSIALLNNLYANRLNYYQSNFYNNIETVKSREYNTDIYVTTIPVADENSDAIGLYVGVASSNKETPMVYAQNNNTTMTINASLSILNQTTQVMKNPIIISNGEIVNSESMAGQTGVADNYVYLGFTANRDIKEYKVNSTDAQTMLNDGCLNVIDAYYKLVSDYIATDLTHVVTNETGVVENPHPRQAIGIKADKSIVIVTTDGRSSASRGLTSAELQQVMISNGCKNAWNLDGGGSTSTSIRGTKINGDVDGKRTTDRYIKFTLNAKAPIISKDIADVYAEIGKVRDLTIDQANESFIASKDYSETNLNEISGQSVFGYGNGMTNKPASAGNGYIINIPHVEPRWYGKYGKQIYFDRDENAIYSRTQVNETWSDWVNLTVKPMAYASGAGVNIAETNVYQNMSFNLNRTNASVTGNALKFENNAFICDKPCGIKFSANVTFNSQNTSNKFIKIVNASGDEVAASSVSGIASGRCQVSVSGYTNVTTVDGNKNKFMLQVYGTQGESINKATITVEMDR